MVRLILAFATLAIASCISTSTPTNASAVEECDVLVLGAGLAGTSAAWRLVGERPAEDTGPPPRVCVLEASDRIGGRTKDYDIPDCSTRQTVELGAQWIAQAEVDVDVWDLAVNVLNLGIYNGWPWALYGFPYGPAFIDPAVRSEADKVPSASSPEYDGGRMFFGPNVSANNPQAGQECQNMVAHVYDGIVLGSPWLTPGANALDALTPLEWLHSLGCNITKADVIAQGLNQVDIAKPTFPLSPAFYISTTTAGSSGQEVLWQSSALWWLHNVKSNSGPISLAVDVQRYRIVGGVMQMSHRLAEKLQAAGQPIELNSPVQHIRYSSNSVEFTTTKGRVFRGRYAIITGTPVALSTHLSWDPPLSAGVEKMLKSSHLGNYNKHYAFFKEGPIWRDNPDLWKAISKVSIQWPMVYEAAPPLPADSQQMPNGTDFFPSPIIDNSPASTNMHDATCPNGAGALFTFGWPANGSTAAERAEGWRTLLRSVPGLPEPSSVHGQAWAEEPYVMGAYAAWWPPGTITEAAEQWQAVPGGRVFFAGSEWAEVGAGFMNGAIHNGRKHGSMVHNLLRKDEHGKMRSVDWV